MPDKDWLHHEHLTSGRTLKEIAYAIGAAPKTLQRWAKRLGLYDGLVTPVRVGAGSGARFYGVTPKWLREQYLDKNMSQQQIAENLGTSRHAVIQWLRHAGIPVLSDKERNARHSERMTGMGNPAWKTGSSQRFQRNLLKRSGRPYQCDWYGRTKHLQVHHRDHDSGNCTLDNLAWFCGNCNRLEAQLYQLARHGCIDYELKGTTLVVEFNQWRQP